MNKELKQFRLAAYIEGWSFLILLFVAMPLKYLMGFAIATKIVGMAHGALFMWFLYALYMSASEQKWGSKFSIIAFTASLVPFGTFFLDKKLAPMDTSDEEEVSTEN